MYDSDPDDVTRLGWDEFILRQWESIFTGYRTWAGLRQIGRRWADLIEGGLGCSQELADRLVRDEIINGPDWQVGAANADRVLTGMAAVLEAIRADLAAFGQSGELAPGVVAAMLDRHARLAAAVGVPASARVLAAGPFTAAGGTTLPSAERPGDGASIS